MVAACGSSWGSCAIYKEAFESGDPFFFFFSLGRCSLARLESAPVCVCAGWLKRSKCPIPHKEEDVAMLLGGCVLQEGPSWALPALQAWAGVAVSRGSSAVSVDPCWV